MPILIPIPVGKKFGFLTVTSEPQRDGRQIKYECVCDCGKKHQCNGDSLRGGRTQSCGCKNAKLVALRETTHGESKTKLYKVWRGMHDRCENPNHGSYQYYGRKGIAVEIEFYPYELFSKWAKSHGYAEGLMLERKDGSRNYCPENCIWATPRVQARNRSSNRRLNFNGRNLCIVEWAKELGISKETICSRLRKGLPLELVLRTMNIPE